MVVEDTGVGIPKDVSPKLFTPLFTTKAKGQGFGLAVVKRMTEALGGTVTFESEVGRGRRSLFVCLRKQKPLALNILYKNPKLVGKKPYRKVYFC